MDECCCHKTKHRSPQEQKQLTNRLSRIEGQVRGLRDMLQADAYCPDILVQVSAVSAAPAWPTGYGRAMTKSSTSW